MKIPLIQPGLEYPELQVEIDKAISDVLKSESFILGKQLEFFEYEFSQWSGITYCVGVGNGTEALELSLLSLGVERGDRVILPVNTFAATALAPIRIGAIPIFIDCDKDSYLLDLSLLNNIKAKAILPVHLYGSYINVEELKSVIDPEMYIVEDAAQFQTKRNIIGDIVSTSFYPTKNLGCYGDGGAIMTDNESVFKKLKGLRNYGSVSKYNHDYIGYNSRLDEIQAAVLRIKLKYLENNNKKRIQAAAYYDFLLAPLSIKKQKTANSIYHLYVIEVEQRNNCVEFLSQRGITTGIHYPKPLHLQPAFSYLGYRKGDFPNSEILSESIISLPIYPSIKKEEQEYVVESLKDFYGKL